MDIYIQKQLERLSDLQTKQSVEYKKWLSKKLNGKVNQLDFAYSLSSDSQHISGEIDDKFRTLLNIVFLKFDRKLQKDKKVLNRPMNERTQYIFFPENKSNFSHRDTISHFHGVVSLPENHKCNDFELSQLLESLSFWMDSYAAKFGLVKKRNRLNHKFSKRTILCDDDTRSRAAGYIVKQQHFDNALGRAINFGNLVKH